ncbi:MAG: two-component response regulator [Candidatus Scalindua rubra]|uniref:Two-component response regulator n=1 Tax=Candidatus Scalindua rubra TaxID=1872076 RepID=A0A1E3XCE8_9BACT|nr:MAG: two-component response regulator [Candidatus Scalindua rubra]
MNKLIAIVDDEPDIVELVSINLKKAMFKVDGFSDAESFYRFLDVKIPDLIILDLMLPNADGLEICKYLKREDKFSSIPIIMLTAKGEETDKVLGLEFGADDYVTKPFSPKELVARVKAVLRRRQKDEGSRKLDIGGILTIDLETYEVVVEGRKIELTSTEFRILKLLLSKKSKVFPRHDILDHLWGHDKIVLDRTIDVHIKNLRDKLGKAGQFIKNIRGIGYKLEE